MINGKEYSSYVFQKKIGRNGVTGCGIMAGVILTVERLQKYKEVDVYRTVLHLLRVQPQFFTSQVRIERTF